VALVTIYGLVAASQGKSCKVVIDFGIFPGFGGVANFAFFDELSASRVIRGITIVFCLFPIGLMTGPAIVRGFPTPILMAARTIRFPMCTS
jgi:hypothetical protein